MPSQCKLSTRVESSKEYHKRTCDNRITSVFECTYVDEEDNERFPNGLSLPRGFSAIVWCLKERVALPLMKHETVEDNNIADGDIVQFDSLEEADTLLQNHEKNLEQNHWTWMDNHNTLIPEVTKVIRKFGGPPKPILYLEPGDLLFDHYWYPTNEELEPHHTILFLRPRPCSQKPPRDDGGA